ncbi:MAG: septal ring lytic transglycosylase RlpA family protein [Solirubrobacteraceae bacterium]
MALAVAGCGSSSSLQRSSTVSDSRSTTTVATSQATVPRVHPQAVEPVAGQQAKGRARGHAGASGLSVLSANPSLSQPATVTRAPAKDAPSDAQVRAAVAQFQSAVAYYHLNELNFSGELLKLSELPPGEFFTSIASVYTDYGKPVACGGVLHVPELGVANKTLPCGTKVIFVYGGRAIKVPVIDRGPYIAGREWDLTGATAEALRFPGLGPIRWRIAH